MVVMLPNLNQYDQIQHSPWRYDHAPHVRDLMALGPRYALLSCEISIFRVNKVRCGPSGDQALSKIQAHQSVDLKYKTDKRLPSSPLPQHRNRSLQEYPASAADILYRTPARRAEVPSV